MIVNSLHSKVPQLASGGRIDGGEFGRSIWTSGLALLATDSGCWTWWWLVLGLLLLQRIISIIRCIMRNNPPIPSCPSHLCCLRLDQLLRARTVDFPLMLSILVFSPSSRSLPSCPQRFPSAAMTRNEGLKYRRDPLGLIDNLRLMDGWCKEFGVCNGRGASLKLSRRQRREWQLGSALSLQPRLQP